MPTELPIPLQESDCGNSSSSRQGGCSKVWTSPWVLLNVFLAIGAQDDSRLWVMLPSRSVR